MWVVAWARVALLMQHATRMRHIVLSLAASLAPPYFLTLPHKRHDFQKQVSEHEMCVLTLYTTFILNISNSRKNSAKNCHKCENIFM